MKVYSALFSVDYEGQDLLGVFADRDSAVAYIRSLEDFQDGLYGDYCVVESELGRPLDGYHHIEVVEAE